MRMSTNPSKTLGGCVLLTVLAGLTPLQSWAQNADQATNQVSPGELVINNPTLINLGFEWHIQGDENRNSEVAVSYRRVGESAWLPGMPLLRLNGEQVYQENIWDLVSPPMFAGSILDLEPGTPYEARFELSDPDGVAGPASEATKIVTVSTRPEPVPAEGGAVYHVYPSTYEGPREEPSFSGIMCAYNYRCGAGDSAPGGRPRVKPGDVILVHAGTYAYFYEFYANNTRYNATTTFEGTYYLTADGTAERPIVIKAAGDGEVIIDGRGNFNLFNTKAADYNYFEGITFRNTDIAIWAGTQFIAGSKGLTVKNSRFEDIGMGIFTNWSGSSDFTILDNVFLGRLDPNHVMGWNGAFWQQFGGVDGQTFPPVMTSYTAVRIYGPGHVVAYNHIQDFHDGIDVETYGNPDGSHAVEGPQYPPRDYWHLRPVAIDFYNNYMSNFHDNAIEIDGGLHNIRVMRNIMINSASHPMCNQPSGGGPVYWIRNIVYHAPGGATRMSSGSPGVIYYNNTIFTESVTGTSANLHWRNNVILGQNAQPAIFNVTTNTGYSTSDYNGFRPNPGVEASFHWNSPAQVDGVGDGTRDSLVLRPFATLQEYADATGQDRNSVLIYYDDFVNVPELDAKDLATVQRVHDARALDFNLKEGSIAVDAGIAIPNITDGFDGDAPDLGALEFGKPMPVYGPRTQGI
ncbi:MAG: hypothetical protein Q7V56_14165 [Gammaproteobacteria bacterium]|nr:hypothetical protein [Gammaproteobacteria bacterium]